MLDGFDDAVVVITGGASGIGRGIALEAARRGAKVAIADVNDERLATTLAELEAAGTDAIAVHCDVTRDADVDALRDQVIERWGHVDLLCNNAGVAVLGPAERVLMEDWEWILQINVLGIVRGIRAFVPGMLERGKGHVLNTASVAGIWAYTWDAAPYITSKFAAYGLSEGAGPTPAPARARCVGAVPRPRHHQPRRQRPLLRRARRPGGRLGLLPAGDARSA